MSKMEAPNGARDNSNIKLIKPGDLDERFVAGMFVRLKDDISPPFNLPENQQPICWEVIGFEFDEKTRAPIVTETDMNKLSATAIIKPIFYRKDDSYEESVKEREEREHREEEMLNATWRVHMDDIEIVSDTIHEKDIQHVLRLSESYEGKIQELKINGYVENYEIENVMVIKGKVFFKIKPIGIQQEVIGQKGVGDKYVFHERESITIPEEEFENAKVYKSVFADDDLKKKK